MTRSLRLEVFETPDQPDGPVLLMPEEVEDIRLNAYERGYGAGWDDGGQQAEAEETARRAAFARQAEQLTFTYHEARGHVLAALKPVIAAVLDTVLPAAVRASVVPLAIEQLMPLAHAAAEAPITLRIAPGRLADFEAAFDGLVLPPLDLVETGDLAEGQAEFTFGALETRIDLAHAAAVVRAAIDRFYLIQTEESRRA
ncbi:MAG: hypothetical protein H6898_04765 [Rhodobacter sp.]|nr:hypothetical protein [Paracoccaceae bacterium]MCC0075882.1 hypothetical protein [Rhodobacter sp.]